MEKNFKLFDTTSTEKCGCPSTKSREMSSRNRVVSDSQTNLWASAARREQVEKFQLFRVSECFELQNTLIASHLF